MRIHAACFLVLCAAHAHAALLPPVPEFNQYQMQKSLTGKTIGKTSICLVDTNVYSIADKKGAQTAMGQSITDPQTFNAGSQSRCLIQLDNGDQVTLGNNTLLQIQQQGKTTVVNFWYGSLIVRIQQQRQWEINSAQGQVVLSKGHYAFKSRHNRELDIVTYDTKAILTSTPPTTIPLGNVLKIRDGKHTVVRLSNTLKKIITNRVSPENPYLAQSLKIFNQNQLTKAKKKFQQLQLAYPENAESAYYLGTIAFKEGNNKETIKQWNKFTQLDPKKAEERDVLKNLTLIKREENTKEIKNIVKNESYYSAEPPEPGTIAVLPFSNEGDKQYNIISKGLTAMVITDLAKVPGLKVLEREKVQKLIDEIKLSQSGLVDKETKLKTGKILRAAKVIQGSFNIAK